MTRLLAVLCLAVLCAGCSGFGGKRSIGTKITGFGCSVEWTSTVDGAYPVPQTVDAAPAK